MADAAIQIGCKIKSLLATRSIQQQLHIPEKKYIIKMVSSGRLNLLWTCHEFVNMKEINKNYMKINK